MPIYEYEHQNKACELGEVFELEQSIKDDRLERCPDCGGAIKRLISRTFVSSPTTPSEYKEKGFTMLKRRDSGVYENLTRRGNESRYMEAGKPETMPDLKKTISD